MSRSHIGLAIAIATLLTVLLACNLPFVVTRTPTAPEEVSDPQVAALRQLEAASETPPDLYFQNGFPRFVSGSFRVEGADAVGRARTFLETYQDLYRIASPDLKLAVRRVSEGEAETNVVFYQTYQGIEVFASEIVVTLNGDRVYATVGGLLNGDVALDITPILFAPQAEEIARADVGLPDAPVAGTTTLMVFDPSMLDNVPPDPHLAWRVTFGGTDPWQVFVDAHTGQVLFKYSLVQPGAGLEDYDFDLQDALGGGPWDCYWFSGDTIGDEDGLISSYHSNPEAVAIWWFARDVYLFYHDTFGRHSYDNDDAEFEVFINADVPNAGWYSGCGMMVHARGWVGQDILAHEFTHGVIRSTSDLVYANQPGALNESYADVMAALLDGNWTIGEGRVGGGGAIRDLSNPPAFGHPDRMSIFFRTPTRNDNGGVHTNSGIPNKAAFLIADGGTHNGWTVTGIGRGKLGFLYYNVMTTGLGRNALFIDARNASVARADRWASAGTRGFTRLDACQVRNAFAAVELGDGDRDCDGTEDATDTDDDNDYIPDSRDNCPLVANPGQQDTDRDGQGDACDADDDNDGVPDATDNCRLIANNVQQDTDEDGIGDACEDEDRDGVRDPLDNCLGVANRDQRDNDNDGLGDACDADDDGDTVPDVSDNCPLRYNPDQTDTDGDGVGNDCDNCRETANRDQADTDGDGAGDACDTDDDGDTVPDVSDNCQFVLNPDQIDIDKNGAGLACDEDEAFMLDGIPIDVIIRGYPGRLQRVPIPICLADSCPDSFPSDYRVNIVLAGFPANVGVWVTDDEGNSVGKSPYEDLRALRFRPLGGRQYFLNFVFGSDFPEGGQASFSASMSAGPAEEQPNPTPGGPTPIPLPPPPPFRPVSGITPTPTETPGAPASIPTFTSAAPASIPTFTFSQNANCRKGPSKDYEAVTAFLQGQSVQIDGRNQNEPRWWWVLIPGSGGHCWVSDSTGSASGPLGGVKVVSAPPLPPTPTFTPTAAQISAPAAPGKFQVNDKSCSSSGYIVTLSWQDVSSEQGYRVYRDGVVIATLSPNTTQYDDAAPDFNPHTYYVEAYNSSGSANSPSANSQGCLYQ